MSETKGITPGILVSLSVSAVSDGLHNDKEESKKRSPQNDILTAIGAIMSEVEVLITEVRKIEQSKFTSREVAREKKTTSVFQLSREQEGILQSLF